MAKNLAVNNLTAHQLYAQIAPATDNLTFVNKMTLQLDDFLVSCVASRLSPATIKYYREFLGWFVTWCKGKDITNSQDITATNIREYLYDCSLRMKPVSVDAHYRAIHRFMRWLLREEVLETNPMEKVDRPKVPKLITEILPADIIQRMLSLCDDTTLPGARDKLLILFFIGTGGRLAEITNIQLSDIDHRMRRIKLLGKGAKERFIGLPDPVSAALLRYLRLRKDKLPCLWVSVSPNNRPLINPSALRQIITRIKKRAGITTRVYPHKFRHTNGSMLLEAGMDRGNVQTLLGHETDTMTRHYTKTVLNKVALRQQENIHPMDRFLQKPKK